MPSFDIVSEVDEVEIKNAVDNANRILSTRFDFKGVDASIELKELVVTLKCESEFQVDQLVQILRDAAAKRNVDPNSMNTDSSFNHSGKTYSKQVTFRQGIDQPTAKKIIKQIKDAKLKVQASIQGEEIRVSGKKRDDLQSCIQLLKSTDQELPLQYKNFRD